MSQIFSAGDRRNNSARRLLGRSDGPQGYLAMDQIVMAIHAGLFFLQGFFAGVLSPLFLGLHFRLDMAGAAWAAVGGKHGIADRIGLPGDRRIISAAPLRARQAPIAEQVGVGKIWV